MFWITTKIRKKVSRDGGGGVDKIIIAKAAGVRVTAVSSNSCATQNFDFTLTLSWERQKF